MPPWCSPGPGRTVALYGEHIQRALDGGPDLVVDDGGDLMETLHAQRPDLLGKVAAAASRPRPG